MRQKKSGLSNLVLITQLGINVLTPVFLCVLAGVWIDKRFGTDTVLIFLILGILAGGLSAYRIAKSTIDKEKKELDKEKEEKVKEWEDRFGAEGGTGRKDQEIRKLRGGDRDE